MTATAVNVNGQVFDGEHAVISVFDHGFLYGEGIYETLRTYNGRPFLFERHMRRLRTSADMIALPIPLTSEQIADRFAETVRAAGLATGPDTRPTSASWSPAASAISPTIRPPRRFRPWS